MHVQLYHGACGAIQHLNKKLADGDSLPNWKNVKKIVLNNGFRIHQNLSLMPVETVGNL